MMVYLLANIVGIMLAVYKFHSMGVLPTHQSDWLEFMEPRKVNSRVAEKAAPCTAWGHLIRHSRTLQLTSPVAAKLASCRPTNIG